jgi:hypothetical protein
MNRDDTKARLNQLLSEAKDIFRDELIRTQPKLAMDANVKELSAHANISTAQRYQIWYSKIIPIMRQLGPDRFEEFIQLYKPDPRRKSADLLNYRIKDYLLGTRHRDTDPFFAFSSLFQHQITIVEAVYFTADQRLNDLEVVVRTDLFRHELDAADHLLARKHLRAAGALAGVTLEGHLARTCKDHNLPITKRAPTLADFYEALKQNSLIDTPTWRLLQRLGDIRNLCVHAKGREPTLDEIVDLIAGTRKAIAEIL